MAVDKNAGIDRYDFLIGAVTGVFSGLLDVFFVGTPGDSLLESWTDKKTNDIVMKFAEYKGFKPTGGSLDLQHAIQKLEGEYHVNYDQGKSIDTAYAVGHLLPKNHHLKSIGHNPDLIGLCFSIIDQFQGKSSFLDNGKLIRINSDFELAGMDFSSKVYAGATNWFGHIMSDVAGSNSVAGKGNRGSGIPIPFYQLFNLCDFGEFGQHRQTFATVMVQVFENGYDLRHGAAMAIPVIIGDLLTMLGWSIKRHFYHQWPWMDCIPTEQIKSYRRTRLVSKSAFCLVDGVDAYIRGSGNPVAVILRMNLIAWLQLVKLIIKELILTYNNTYEDFGVELDKINKALEEELSFLKSFDYQAWQQENEKVADLNRRLELANGLQVGTLANEYCFANNVKLNYDNPDEFKRLIKDKKPLW